MATKTRKTSKTKRTTRRKTSTRANASTVSRSRSRSATRDRALVSDESYEVEYIHRKFPNSTHRQVVAAIGACKKDLNGSEDRRKIMACVRKKLS